MRVLLDTHVLLWWLADDNRLSPTLREAITDGSNDVLVSAVTIAEIEIKKALGKLSAPRELLILLRETGFAALPLTSEHSQFLRDLPFHHKDPFDRMLIAQATVEKARLASSDPIFSAYDVELLAN